MRKAFSTIIIILAVVAVLSFAAYYRAIYSMGKNFCDDEPLPEGHSNVAPAESMLNRATSPTTYSKLGLDTTLGKILIAASTLQRYQILLICLRQLNVVAIVVILTQKIYFDAKPREIYVSYLFSLVKQPQALSMLYLLSKMPNGLVRNHLT